MVVANSCIGRHAAAPLERIAQIAALPFQVADNRVPVHLKGWVTLSDPTTNLMFLEDGTGATRVTLPFLHLDPRPGNLVEVIGEVTEGGLAPTIVASEVRLLEGSHEPRAFPIQVADLAAGRAGFRYVAVDGVLHSWQQDRLGNAVVKIGSGATTFEAYAFSEAMPSFKGGIGAHIRLRAVANLSRDVYGRTARVRVWIPRATDLEVLAPPPQSIPVQTVGEVAALPRNSLAERMLHLRGSILSDGVRQGLRLEDGTGSIRIRPSSVAVMPLAQVVDVSGFADGEDGELKVTDARLFQANPEQHPTDGNRIITSVAEVHALSPEEAGSAIPVHVRATVTYLDPASTVFFVQDSTGATYVSARRVREIKVQPGDLVDLTGVTAPGQFAPTISNASVERVSSSSMPPPAPAAFDDLLSGKMDSAWVQTEGIVQSTEAKTGGDNLSMQWGDHQYLALVRNPGGRPLPPPDSRVRVQGVCGSLFNARRQIVGIHIYVPSPEFVRVLEPGPDPAALRSHPIDELLRFSFADSPGHRTRIRGLSPWPALPARHTSKIALLASRSSTMRAWISVLATGRRARFRALRFLQPGNEGRADLARRTGSRTAAAVHNRGRSLGRRLRFQIGQHRCRRRGPTQEHDPERRDASGGWQAVQRHPGLRAGSTAGAGQRRPCAGVCSIAAEGNLAYRIPKSFSLILRGASDIAVVRSASWWTPGRLLAVLGSMAALLLVVLSWVAVLRRRVVLQTAVIRRKLQQEELLKHAAEQASRAKSEFLANMSHEIRTPLNGILGFAGLMADSGLTGLQREHNEAVRSSAENLLVVINDILDFSRVEAGKLELESLSFSIRQCVEAALGSVQSLAAEKGLATSIQIDADVPDWVRGDPHRLRQVLLNLLGNAVKFTAAGGISARVSNAPEPQAAADGSAGAPAPQQIRFAVSDTGIGIPEPQREMIFLPFRQADGWVTRRFGGTGLGLAISRKLVAMMGGAMSLESAEGQGSTFSFTASLPPGQAPASGEVPDMAANGRSTAERPPRRPLSILVAEDNVVNQRLIGILLEKRGHRVTVVANGVAAVAAWLREESLRLHSDGHSDAGNGRIRSHPPHPGP